ncbi:hypothetical protein BpHYR1_019726 [Brachionus plicatilis]|uniref:Uncharacterized protein n=1 Tax=Brachionus plicatilis TaxID=10195 RepID=A0A3M7PXY3_BRAPC|nr:hypothetical protein BpHYR1_019726 [Brachionus plicatilis]
MHAKIAIKYDDCDKNLISNIIAQLLRNYKLLILKIRKEFVNDQTKTKKLVGNHIPTLYLIAIINRPHTVPLFIGVQKSAIILIPSGNSI